MKLLSPHAKYKWRLLKRAIHNAIVDRDFNLLKLALFPNRYFILPVDHVPTDGEKRFAEAAHARRMQLSPEERARMQEVFQPIVMPYIDPEERKEQLEYYQGLLKSPGGIYQYPEEDDDGIALNQTPHPRAPWWKRLRFRPKINRNSLETMEITREHE